MLARMLAHVKGLLRRGAADAEVEEELRFHVEMETEANLRRGMTPLEARRVALRDLGGVTQTREAARDVRALWFDVVIRDFRHAIRSLARTPWYTTTTIGVIASAMALTVAVLAVVDGMLFKPLPYRDPSRLFAVSPGFSRLPPPNAWQVSPMELNAWREAVPDVRFAAFTDALYETDTLDTGSHPRVDAQFFDTLGVPVEGPGFSAADFTAHGSITPVVMTHAVWQSHHAGDRSVIGRTFLNKSGLTKRVVGILPAGFIFPSGPWLTETVWPLSVDDPGSRSRTLKVIARLPAGLEAAQVAERLAATTRRLASLWPAPAPGASQRLRIVSGPFDIVRLVPLREALASQSLQTARIAFWGAAALMVLACLNVAGLAAARVQERHHDLVVRRSLGARYVDLVRLIAAENAILVAAGALLGLAGARALIPATTGLMPKGLQFLKPPVIDGRVAAASALAASATVLLITVLPARVAWRSGLHAWLGGGRSATARFRRSGWLIVGGQVAVLTVMAVGGALVVGSLLRVWKEEPGFGANQVANLTVSTYRAPAGTAEDLVRTIAGLPGVRAAGGTDDTVLERPYRLGGSLFDVPPGATAAGRASRNRADDVSDLCREVHVTSGYLEAADLRPVDGRLPTETEWSVRAAIIVVSERVAREYWPGTRAVGQTLMKQGRAFTVVGVVRDARFMSLDERPQPAIYVPDVPILYHLLASFDGSRRTSLQQVVAIIKSRCPSCTVYRAEMLADSVASSIRPRRFNAWLFSSFGIAALVIVGGGILGLVAMTTGRRTREIGIRVALGSTRARIVRQIVGEQARAVAVGLGCGVMVAAWAVKYVESYLYKTQLYDTWIWGAAVATILTITLVGALVPSVRASRANPMRALRVE